MTKNEEETRFYLIDPVLREKGYGWPYLKMERPAPVEPIGPKGRRRPGPGFLRSPLQRVLASVLSSSLDLYWRLARTWIAR